MSLVRPDGRGGSAGGADWRGAGTTALLLLPACIFLGICFLLPLGALFRLSLGGAGGPFGAYAELLGNAVYRQVFLKTMLLALDVAAISVVLAYPAAYLMTRLRGWAFSLAVGCLLLGATRRFLDLGQMAAAP